MFVTTFSRHVTGYCSLVSVLKSLNPLSPKSYQYQISPCNINALENRVAMRITDMITQDEFT